MNAVRRPRRRIGERLVFIALKLCCLALKRLAPG